MDVWWTSSVRSVVQRANETDPCAASSAEPSDGLEPSTPSLPSRARAITRDTVSPANQAVAGGRGASRDVARVVSDVSVLCPRLVVCSHNRERRGWMGLITTMTSWRFIGGPVRPDRTRQQWWSSCNAECRLIEQPVEPHRITCGGSSQSRILSSSVLPSVSSARRVSSGRCNGSLDCARALISISTVAI